MALWPLCEARNVQQFTNASIANAELLIGSNAVPAGKLWIVTAFGYMPDVAETQTITFEKASAAGNIFAVANPVSLALNPARATFIEQGMEYVLFPGEYLLVHRNGHTVGSTMGSYVQWIEIDLPLYTYDEPLIVKRTDRALSTIRQSLASRRASTIPSVRESGGREGRGGKGIPEAV